MTAPAWQITGPGAALQLGQFARRDLQPDDVVIDVLCCGVRGADVHGRDAGSPDPLVPGHEFTSRMSAVGREVATLHPGQLVAVGNIVDSGGTCPMCRAGQENLCRDFPTLTYGGLASGHRPADRPQAPHPGRQRRPGLYP